MQGLEGLEFVGSGPCTGPRRRIRFRGQVVHDFER